MTAENTNEESPNEKPDQQKFSIQGNVDKSIIALGDHNTINQGPSYYTTNVFDSFEVKQFPVRPSQSLSKEEYRWRQVLVQNVKHYWIKGVLERSLHNQALIELGLEERTQAVNSPIKGVDEFEKETEQPFPKGTQTTDIFDNLGAGRTLLILGEPGAGKTITLLKLAETLISRIEDDFSQSIPVILNLSSWAKRRQSIAEWLVQDLHETFQISKALGTSWIKEEQLTLCLDGLDEVAAEHQHACLQALNHFLQNHGRTEIVVCSRIRDYEALPERLSVRCAIYVQPLTSQQIDRYLEQAGEKLSALSMVFETTPEIRSLATSPLLLSVMSLAYQGSALDDFPKMDTVQDFRQRLFDAYIERMFLRRRKTNYYTDQQAKHWLFWMAQRMVETSQTVFFIENMQPSCLQTQGQRLWYRVESSLIVGLIIGLNTCLMVEIVGGIVFGGPIFGLIFGLSTGLIAVNLDEITPVETLQWSWKIAKKSIRTGWMGGLIFGLVVGLVDGVFFMLIEGLVAGLIEGLVAGLISGLISGLIGGLISGLIGGLKGPAMSNKKQPNHGIWKSARNAGMSTIIVGTIFGMIFGPIYRFIDTPHHGLTAGMIAGMTAGMIAGMIAGGSACIRHFSLRLMLYRMGYTPWNYARFLDYATERLFLQKVGGGYIFIHRTLLEHFAQMELE
mgnify:CR=1 FL=1